MFNRMLGIVYLNEHILDRKWQLFTNNYKERILLDNLNKHDAYNNVIFEK